MIRMPDPQATPQWLNSFMALVPWIVIFLFIWIAVYQFLRRKRAEAALSTLEARLASVEQKLERLTAQQDPKHM